MLRGFQIVTNFKIWHKASELKAYNDTPMPWEHSEIIYLEICIMEQTRTRSYKANHQSALYTYNKH